MTHRIPEVRLTEDGHVAVRTGDDDWMVLHPEGEITLLDSSELPDDAPRLAPARPASGDQIETVAQLLHERRHRAGTGHLCGPCRDEATAIAAVFAPAAFAQPGARHAFADGTD